MKLSVSNIAWQSNEKEKIFPLLSLYGFSGLEFAPGLLTQENENAYFCDNDKLNKISEYYKNHNLKFTSMQSILYGCENAALFENETKRERLLDYVKHAIDFASKLNVKNLVFGAPKNRIVPETMTKNEADIIAREIFKEIGNYAFSKNTKVSLEPNAKEYGTNWLTTTKDTIDFLLSLDNSGIALNLDLGTMIINSENTDIIKNNVNLINHVHISAPFLQMLDPFNLDFYKTVIEYLSTNGYNGWYSLEMKRPDKETFDNIKKTLDFISNKIFSLETVYANE